MIHILLFLLCLVNSHDGVYSIQHTLQEDLELEKQLELINKVPVKSIHVFYISFSVYYCIFSFLFLLNLISLSSSISHFFIYNVLLILQTKYGYIVDCIDIYKQPAFDHPLLKDHKLQVHSFEHFQIQSNFSFFLIIFIFDLFDYRENPVFKTHLKRQV